MTTEYIDLIIKVGTFIIAFIAIPKYYNDFKFLKKEKLKDDYNFSEKIIANEKYKSLHDFLLEKSFFTLMEHKLKADEIRFFLEQNNPMKKFSDFIKSYSYLEVIKYDDKLKLDFKHKYLSSSKRKLLIYSNNILYFIFAGISMVPIFIIGELKELPLFSILLVIVMVLSLFSMAVMSLNNTFNIKNANTLVEESKEISIILTKPRSETLP